MRSLFGACLVATALACATHAPAAPDRQPEWLSGLIGQLAGQPVANPPSFVARYTWRGQTVYFVPSRCCDIASTVYAADGAILCHPDGGFTGAGDGKCPTFADERTGEAIVWRDARGGP